MTDTTATTKHTGSRASVSAWAPFAHSAFALLWTATLFSNIGTWMHDVGAGWLMTTLNPSPAVVTLVQAATTLPIFLFALLAGTLADRVNKRSLLITVNVIMFLVVSVLSVLVWLEQMTPLLLILFTFAVGTGAAFLGPTWQSIVPELVPRKELQPAIALNSMGINISRAIGPAVAGFLITAFGLAAPFALNAVSHVLIVVALFIWRPQPSQISGLPPAPMGSAMLTGLRHAGHNGPLKATLVRALGFFFFASAYWALLPLIARGLPGGGAELYGFLLGAIGAGAVLGALLLPKIKTRFDTNQMAAMGTVVTAAAMLCLALISLIPLAVMAAFLGGLGWITVLTSLNISAQTALPNWVRARGLSVYLMVFFGAMALGSTLWGQLASFTSVSITLLVSGLGLIVVIPVTWRAKLGQGDDLDLSPSSHWPTPVVNDTLDDLDHRGPVMVSIEYEIDPKNEQGFLNAIRELADERYRDGAFQWGVYQDTHQTERWIEWFLVSSWAEHLRQHQRTTRHDQALQAAVREFHKGEQPPVVNHWVAPGTSHAASGEEPKT